MENPAHFRVEINTRRSKSPAALLAVFYPRGISAGDFQEALSAFPGTDAPNL